VPAACWLLYLSISSIATFQNIESDTIVQFLVGIFFLLMGLKAGPSYEGTQIDNTELKYKRYGTFLGVKSGTWKSYKGFTSLSILKRNKKITEQCKDCSPWNLSGWCMK
jgi:hypothetical protein